MGASCLTTYSWGFQSTAPQPSSSLPISPRTDGSRSTPPPSPPSFPVYSPSETFRAPVPRAGGIAEGEAATVVNVLVSQLTNGNDPPPYDGASACYVELGDDLVGRIDVNFLSYDTPVAKFSAPTSAMSRGETTVGCNPRRSMVWTVELLGSMRI